MHAARSALEFIIAIPARLGSTRLPGKLLRLLAGEALIVHVARRALEAGAREVWVATDDQGIADALEHLDVQVAMTAPHLASGTDRIAQCAQHAQWDDDAIVVNLQGDEPFVPVAGIRAVAELLRDSAANVATLSAPIGDAATLFDPNVVKIVCGDNGDALYFSRAPIPWPRDAFARDRDRLPGGGHWLRHVGIYAYRCAFLRRFAQLPAGRLETIESLEQLRVLEAGHRIAVAQTPEPFPPGIDTAADLERAERSMAALPAGSVHD